MKLYKSFKIALNIILHSKLRSWLTIIGIVIGIAAIVSIISISQGAQRSLEQNLNTLNADILTINPGFSRASGAGADFRGGGFEGGPGNQGPSTNTPKNLTIKDVTILRGIPNIDKVMGIISGSVSTTYVSKSAKVNIQGVDPAVWRDTTSVELLSGRFLVQGDVAAVVIGGRVANSTFSDVQTNRQITIGGKTFKIAGILKQSGGSEDSRIFMPIQSAVTVIENKENNVYDSIVVKEKDISLTDDTVAQITSKLMLSHSILQANKKDFSVNSLQAVQQRITSTLSSVSLFLSAIAAVSLLVGAIGIMNSMFTSTLEKTKDIGILKALGAKNRDILAIFLFNAGVIGLVGGILGTILGIIGSSLVGQLTSGSSGISLGRLSLSSAYVSPTLVIEVFLLSMIVGLIYGAIPAYRASRLKPVDALRYE